MNVVLLTTETTHHAYLACKVNERFPLKAVVVESWRPKIPYETSHAFEKRRDEYEREVFLPAGPRAFHELADVHACERVNDARTIAALERIKPDVLLLFGTAPIKPAVFGVARLACLNLHGGNPEEYRGLDSHLWAIYHKDFDNLITTLHCVDEGLDTGDIAFQARLDIEQGTELHQLRAINTRVCVQLSLQALDALSSTGSIPTRKQKQRGRYYSRMPACLTQQCVTTFQSYTKVR